MDVRFLRFLIVGLLNTAFGFSCYSVLILLGFHFALSAALSTILGVMFNFKSIGYFVFQSNGNNRFLVFVLIYLFVYLSNIFLIYMLVTFGFGEISAAAIITLPLAVSSFFLQKRFVFKNA